MFPHARRFLGFADLKLASLTEAEAGARAGDLRVEIDPGAPGSTCTSGAAVAAEPGSTRRPRDTGGAGWKALRGRYCFTGLGSEAPRVWTVVGAFESRA